MVNALLSQLCRSEWQERMYIYKWREVDQTKHEIFCVHIVCNEIQVKVNLEITTFFFYLRFPYCPNFFWFGVVKSVLSYGLFTPWLINKLTITLLTSTPERNNILFIIGLRYNYVICHFNSLNSLKQDSDWLSMFLELFLWKKSFESDSNDIVSLWHYC